MQGQKGRLSWVH